MDRRAARRPGRRPHHAEELALNRETSTSKSTSAACLGSRLGASGAARIKPNAVRICGVLRPHFLVSLAGEKRCVHRSCVCHEPQELRPPFLSTFWRAARLSCWRTPNRQRLIIVLPVRKTKRPRAAIGFIAPITSTSAVAGICDARTAVSRRSHRGRASQRRSPPQSHPWPMPAPRSGHKPSSARIITPHLFRPIPQPPPVSTPVQQTHPYGMRPRPWRRAGPSRRRQAPFPNR